MDYLASITPKDLALSKNPIIVNVDPVNPATFPVRAGLRYLLDVYTPKFFQASEYALLTTLEASEEPPKSFADVVTYAGAYFDLSELLHSQLMSCPPAFGQQVISVCDTLTSSFYTKARRFEGETLIDESLFPIGTVFRAGIGPADYADFQATFFTRYTQGRKFLTYKPNGLSIRPDQPEFLTFLTNFSPTPAELHLRVQLQFDDFTRQTFTAKTLAGITAMTAYCIPVGVQALGLMSLAKPVLRYEVWLSNENEERLSETRTYIMDTTQHRQVRYLIFENSLGAFDTIAFTGSGSESLLVARQLADRFTGFDFLPTSSEQVINRVTGERQLSVAFGYPAHQAKAQREWWQELYFSEQFYLITDREMIPLLPMTESYLPLDDAETLINRSMTFRYTNAERSYSKLPILPPVPARPTSWRGDAPACETNAVSGLRTNLKRYGLLVKYYLDTGEDVKPYTQKPNNPGTEGYIGSWISADCAPGLTTFLSEEITGMSSFMKIGCPDGYVGTRWMITIPAGVYGSESSQTDANARAQVAWAALDTQSSANQNGSCILASPIPLGLRNNCPGDGIGFTGAAYNPIAAVRKNEVEVIANTAYSVDVRYAAAGLVAGTYTLDIKASFASAPTLPYKIRIPTKNLSSPVLNGNQTFRFANVPVAWGDDELILVIEQA
ncbi:DUF5977 domain-containing protein [Arundinibacter roseus]|uniref:DUF5977 domain-containing protein n=1 Tax=Arundinibacter roseus TaxID=2070510 RepID=A0A4R4K9B4_9BACT|nr:DUF5977 domain-containing protein [Arundinibacter roseus]TDB64357.1 hypothetical protein EZE20_11785 [Arundinibacter roseus]